MRPNEFPENVFGISPKGGNADEGDSIEGVPLVFDPITGVWVSEQAYEEEQDRITDEIQRLAFEEEENFRRKAGYRRT